MAVKLNSTGGGSVTLDSPSTASNYTITLPSAAGTLATTTGTGSVFTNPTINGFTGDTSAITIGTTQFVKDTSGNIGIGTASPGAKLEVYVGNGTLDATGLILNNAYNNYSTAYNGSTSIIAKGYSYQGFAQTTIGQIQFALDSGFDSGWGSSIRFYTSSTRGSVAERLRLDASGNLGLGVTPSTAWSSSAKALQFSGGSIFQYNSDRMFLRQNSFVNSANIDVYTANGLATSYRQYNGQHDWWIAPNNTSGAGATCILTQAMTLDASGNLYVGGTTAYGAKINCIGNFGCFTATAALSGYVGANVFRVDSTTVPTLEINNQGATGRFVTFQTNGASQVGSISFTNTNTAYNTSSDQRLKTNVTPAGSAIQSILNFPVDQFDWISTGEHQDFGAVAQKAINFIPEMVQSSEDPEEMWGIDWSKAVPRLIKTIQELSAQNQVLEARLAQLEAK